MLVTILLQNENGEFSEAGQNINLGSTQIVSCAVGDFNGDSIPDILVSKKKVCPVFQNFLLFC